MNMTLPPSRLSLVGDSTIADFDSGWTEPHELSKSMPKGTLITGLPSTPQPNDPQVMARDATSATVRFARLAYDVANKLSRAFDEGPESVTQVVRQNLTPLKNAYAWSLHEVHPEGVGTEIGPARVKLNEAVKRLFKIALTDPGSCPAMEPIRVNLLSRELHSLCRPSPEGGIPVDHEIHLDMVMAEPPEPLSKAESAGDDASEDRPEVPERVYKDWPSLSKAAKEYGDRPSKSTISEWIRSGKVTAYKLGSQWRIDMESLRRYREHRYPNE